MDDARWLEKADRLLTEWDRLTGAGFVHRSAQRIFLALWLRREFGGPHDTAGTTPPIPGGPHGVAE